MRKFLNFMFSRVVVVSLLIILQIGVLVHFTLNLGSCSVAVYVTLYLASIAAVLWLVSRDGNPSFKISWIILVMALPMVGGVIYLVFGHRPVPLGTGKRLKRYLQADRALFEPREGAAEELRASLPEYAVPSDYLTRVTGFPPYRNTDVSYCPLGEVFFARLKEELARAEHFVFLEFFIIEKGRMWNETLEILKERIAHGVEVCLMYDDFGCIRRLPLSYLRELESLGVRAAIFNRYHPAIDPRMNYRDHRKIVVIDGKVGFTGGLNLADEYINEVDRFGHWKDTAVILRGEAVSGLTRIFLQSWAALRPGRLLRPFGFYLASPPVRASGFVQPYPDSPLDDLPVAETTYRQMISRAGRYVYLSTPYLLPGYEILSALCAAARSGVDVRILMPHVPDKKFVHLLSQSHYATLLKAGVRVFEYTPGFVHAKMFCADDRTAIVGTANLDYRSLHLHFEDNVLLFDAPAVLDIRRDFLDTFAECEEITPEEVERRFRGKRLLTVALKLIAPLL